MNAQHRLPTETIDLVASARAGSLEALGELYRRHADQVHTLAYRLTGSLDDAADVLQDVFVGLPRALRAYREEGRFGAWLKQVTVRTCQMRWRAERRKRESPLDDRMELCEQSPSHPLDMLAVERALAGLPDALRSVFVLRELEGYTHAEIADLLGISTINSATRLSRAWSRLRKELQ